MVAPAALLLSCLAACAAPQPPHFSNWPADASPAEVGKRVAENFVPLITAEPRYWIDDMYMIPAVQVQAFRATGDAKYLDRG